MIILEILLAILVIVIAGTCNMFFVKLPILNWLKRPMDMGATLADGKRIFGDNKTWKGFVGMILWTAIWFAIFTIIAKASDSFYNLAWFSYRLYSTPESLLYGGIWGLGYVLFELPNSFIKRRLDVKPGKRASGFYKSIFIFVDQADSAIGCGLALYVFFTPPLWQMLVFIVLGIAVHFLMNVILYSVGLKRELL